MRDPTQRFSSRVAYYIRYRPGYPDEMIPLLEADDQLCRGDVVADIGCGTGRLSETFLTHGYTVIGVEPNREMRLAGERQLRRYANFRSVDGRAEATTIDARSVNLVAAGQSFHWFDPGRAREEFRRVLRPGGRVLLVWNNRRTQASPFMLGYERLLKDHGTDYEQVNHQKIDEAVIRGFFGEREYRERRLDNRQLLDLEGLKGRLLSSSYTPEEGEPGYREMIDGIERLFRQHHTDGRVDLEYDTRLYYGEFA